MSSNARAEHESKHQPTATPANRQPHPRHHAALPRQRGRRLQARRVSPRIFRPPRRLPCWWAGDRPRLAHRTAGLTFRGLAAEACPFPPSAMCHTRQPRQPLSVTALRTGHPARACVRGSLPLAIAVRHPYMLAIAVRHPYNGNQSKRTSSRRD